MTDHLIKITSDGSITCLYTDAIDLRALGDVHVERASHVEFNNASGKWTVTLADGTFLGSFVSRADALAYEVDVITMRLAGVTS